MISESGATRTPTGRAVRHRGACGPGRQLSHQQRWRRVLAIGHLRLCLGLLLRLRSAGLDKAPVRFMARGGGGLQARVAGLRRVARQDGGVVGG